jgi:hypothetical protein
MNISSASDRVVRLGGLLLILSGHCVGQPTRLPMLSTGSLGRHPLRGTYLSDRKKVLKKMKEEKS